jgi:hypothetical protein
MFHGKEIRPLGFSHRGEVIGERAASEGGPGWLTPWWRRPGVYHTTLGCGRLLAPLHLTFGLREASVKIEGWAFVSSNSENISCVAFLKHKNSKNRELTLWHLINRLVPEMHKNATKCNKTQSKWCINKHGSSKIIDTFETYQ